MKLNITEKCAANGLGVAPSAQDLLNAGVAASTFSLRVGSSCFEAPRTIGGRADLPACRNGCLFRVVIDTITV